MARSNKPLLWLPFAVGGTLAALLLPGMILVMLLPGLELGLPGTPAHPRMVQFAGHWFGALVLFGVLTALLWHAAHRLRMTLQDLGARGSLSRNLVIWCCYGLAALATVVLGATLITLVAGG